MNRGDLDDLAAFAVVAEERSFTKAAARLGMSQSALSHAMKALEARLGVRLLARTTRSVGTTAAGEELLGTLRSAFADIDTGLALLGTRRDTPSGTVRITMGRLALPMVQPKLADFLAAYPEIQVEININDRFVDIVAERFDAGIRFGEQVDKDMVAVRVGPDVRVAVVASPAYLAHQPAPESPRELGIHRCINYRLPSTGALYAWQFAQDGRRLEVRVEGPLVFNDADLIRLAALDGLGIAYLFEEHVRAELADGRLVRVLETWCPPEPGFYLYYPARGQLPPALAALVDALRWRQPSASRSGP